MSLLSFNWDKHFIYAIVYWLLEICVRLFMYFKWDEFFKMSDSDVQNEYIYVVLLTIADLLGGFLVLYIKCSFKTKNKSNTNTRVSSVIDLYYVNYKHNKKKNLIKRLIVICVCTYFSRSLYWISYAITKVQSNDVSHQMQKDVVNTIDIFMRYIFSIFILHIVFHKHRMVSIGGIIIGFCILLPPDFILLSRNRSKKMGLTVAYVAILALRGVSIPFEDTIIKKLFSENYIRPEKFMFYRGITVGIIIAVLTPILYFAFGVKWSISFSTANIITVIIYTLASFVKSFFLMKIIYYFSSQSVSFLVISDSFPGAIFRIIDFIKENNKDAVGYILVIMELLGIIIIAFSTLIYDEVIIINKWGLNTNVRKGIIDRGEEEVIKTIELELATKKLESDNEKIFEDSFSPESGMKVTLTNELGDIGVDEDD